MTTIAERLTDEQIVALAAEASEHIDAELADLPEGAADPEPEDDDLAAGSPAVEDTPADADPPGDTEPVDEYDDEDDEFDAAEPDSRPDGEKHLPGKHSQSRHGDSGGRSSTPPLRSGRPAPKAAVRDVKPGDEIEFELERQDDSGRTIARRQVVTRIVTDVKPVAGMAKPAVELTFEGVKKPQLFTADQPVKIRPRRGQKSADNQVYPHAVGSMEEFAAAVREAVHDGYGPAGDGWASVVATYPDFLVVGQFVPGEKTIHHAVHYSAADGVVTLGDATEIEVDEPDVVGVKSADDGWLVAAEDAKAWAAVGHTLEAKVGRVVSMDDVDAMRAALLHLVTVFQNAGLPVTPDAAVVPEAEIPTVAPVTVDRTSTKTVPYELLAAQAAVARGGL